MAHKALQRPGQGSAHGQDLLSPAAPVDSQRFYEQCDHADVLGPGAGQHDCAGLHFPRPKVVFGILLDHVQSIEAVSPSMGIDQGLHGLERMRLLGRECGL